MLRFILLFLLFFITGCTVKTAPITEYKINTNVQNTNVQKSKYIDKSLKVSQAFSSNSLMTLKMNYIQGTTKKYYYNESQWSQSPNKAVTKQMIKMLREAKLFSSVQVAKSRSKSDLILEIYVEDFMQYYNEDLTKSYVNIAMTLTLIDSKNNQVIASKAFDSKSQTKSLDAKGGVDALNKALENILEKNANWLGEISK